MVQMIVIGVDTHKRSHTLVAVDAATGMVHGQLTIPASDEGTLDALRFAGELDVERVWALEDCRQVSGRLERGLLASDDRVCCHICGRWMKAVGGTHLRWHGWTIDNYREAFQLGQQTPTCARGVSDSLRRAAKRNIGHGGFGKLPPRPAVTRVPPPPWRSLAGVRPELVAELHPTANSSLPIRRRGWLAPQAVVALPHLRARVDSVSPQPRHPRKRVSQMRD
jgi:hypothetical protein